MPHHCSLPGGTIRTPTPSAKHRSAVIFIGKGGAKTRMRQQHRLSIKPGWKTKAGFTLIEVLVVLIIVGLVSGILFQALERAYRLQERFGTELFGVQQAQMSADWYRQTIQGLQPDYQDGPNIFQGNDREFSGLTSNPLSAEYGAPTPITWKITNNRRAGITELVYLEGKRETAILVWRSDEARFIYVDEQQTRHDSWPPPLGLHNQLPKQIQLVAEDAGEIATIVAAIIGPAIPLLRPSDL